MTRKKVLFVGWVNKGKKPVDGETTKNQYIIAELEKYCDVTVLDFYNKKAHPWIYLQAFWAFVTQPKSIIVFSTSAKNIYKILKLFKKMGLKRTIIHWVIGGNIAKCFDNGKYSVDVFNIIDCHLVQCNDMIDDLTRLGLKNVKFVSNFKPIKYYPDLASCHKKRDESGKIRFVFMSRIMFEKGCDYIMKAIRILNDKGLKDKYVVDFYGKVDGRYKSVFDEDVQRFDNVSYHGLLDLKKDAGYDTLATYHAMLFPTYWPGEGFAGVFIDAFIAGLPILASDWAHNREAVVDGKNGVIYPTHDVEALALVMENTINGKYDLQKMSTCCRQEAPNYQADKALSKEYLESIGLVD